MKKPWGFFHKFVQNLPTIYLNHSSRVLSQITHNLITICPTIYSMNLLRVYAEIDPNWEFVLSILKKAQWVCNWAYSEQFMKQLLMSGSDILWANFEQIYGRNPGVFSMSGSGFFFEFTHHFDLNLPTELVEIKVVS